MATHSDWGDWLPRAIEDATPEGISLWYLGCNGFALKGSDGTTLFIDPYLGTGDPPRTVRMVPVPFDPDDVTQADAVLATHEHSDHVDGESQAPILESTGASFYAPDDSLAVAYDDQRWLDGWDVSDDQLVEIEEGDTFDVGEFTIHVEPAHDADATHPVSYVIEHGSTTFFHGGDTKPGDELDTIGEKYDIDLGVLAFGSDGWIPDKETGEPKYTKWYSDENEIVDAADSLQLDCLLPTHWDMWKGLTADPTALFDHTRSYDYPESLEIVEIGDRIDLP
ncbi:MBL fold metallo-hydrolase [Haladaptatus sp. DYF46]|uniref:MBL fold metallo-hydrolase n=1 Tax=Haladaptatus sp. DYF46 TaxID=2886041 RepID=UPI001E326390|nr:MBL fold metallo-hydrolase [Haladaptatus sp. DYF46]